MTPPHAEGSRALPSRAVGVGPFPRCQTSRATGTWFQFCRALSWGMSATAMVVGMFRYAWKAGSHQRREHQVKEDYTQTLRYNVVIMGNWKAICILKTEHPQKMTEEILRSHFYVALRFCACMCMVCKHFLVFINNCQNTSWPLSSQNTDLSDQTWQRIQTLPTYCRKSTK